MKKFLKRTGIVLLVLVVILVIVALFMPRYIHIEKKMVIKAPAENIYQLAANLRNWDRWSVWNQMDPNWKTTYTGPQEGLNASYSWESQNKDVGSGKAITTMSAPFDSLITALYFMGEETPAYSKFYLKKADGGTELTMVFDTDMGWNLMGRLFGPMIKGEVEKNFGKSLETIRKICEDNPKDAKNGKYEMMVSAENGGPYYSIRDTCSFSTITAKYMQNFPALGMALQKTGLKQQGSPFAIIHAHDSTTFDIEWCIPTDKSGPGDGNVKPGMLKGGKVVKAEYYGTYDAMEPCYNALMAFAKSKNLELDGPPMEIYITAPTSEDYSQVLTIVEWPVK